MGSALANAEANDTMPSFNEEHSMPVVIAAVGLAFGIVGLIVQLS
jgi:hypothetical protein